MLGQLDESTVSHAAERLRMVRRAYERFLALAALDCIMDGTPLAIPRTTLAPSPDGTDREGADRTGPEFGLTVPGLLHGRTRLDD